MFRNWFINLQNHLNDVSTLVIHFDDEIYTEEVLDNLQKRSVLEMSL